MATRRALVGLLVCLTLCISSPIHAVEEGPWEDELVMLQEPEDPVKQVDAKAADAHPKHDPVQQKKREEAQAAVKDVVDPVNSKSKQKKKSVQQEPQTPKGPVIPASVIGNDNHDAAWHCTHCSTTCTTEKCKSWCKEQWCGKAHRGTVSEEKTNSPLFTKTKLHVPLHAGNSWHCAHCNKQCKTERCNDWCKRMWCSVDAHGNPVGANGDKAGSSRSSGSSGSSSDQSDQGSQVKIHAGKNEFTKLEITKGGSRELRRMEHQANSLMRKAQEDTTGKVLRAAMAAVDAAIKRRVEERANRKMKLQLSNEKDQKKYPASRYRRWDAEKESMEAMEAEQLEQAAAEAKEKENSKENHFKTSFQRGSVSEKEQERDVEKAYTRYEARESGIKSS
jgi:hypothetical protein